jgi:hypothetical protein
MDITTLCASGGLQIEVPVANIRLASAQGAGDLPVVPDGFVSGVPSEKMVPVVAMNRRQATEMIATGQPSVSVAILPDENAVPDLISSAGADDNRLRDVPPHSRGDDQHS